MINKITNNDTKSHRLQLWIKDPRHRLWVTLILLAGIVNVSSPVLLYWITGIITIILLWAGISIRYLFRRLLLILPFGFGAIVFLPFIVEGETLFHFGLTVSIEGVERAVLILLKIVGANLLISYLLAVTPLFDLIKSLRSIGIPAVMIEMMNLMMRYFFLLSEEVKAMLKAQKSRGFRPNGWLWSRQTYRRFGELLGVLFIRAYSRSQRIYLSMSARGGFAMKHESIEQFQEIKRGLKMTNMALEVNEVGYRYGDNLVLKNVSMDIKIGTKAALMGPNGAGKSTLISLLNGLESPDKGEIKVFGEIVNDSNREQVRQKVGVVYQDPDDQIFSTTVEEDVAFGPRNLGFSPQEVEELVVMALGSVGMREYRKRSPFELSYGQKRRVAIAGVLAMRPDVLILDEPMAFLDPKGRDDLQALLESMHLMGITIMIATHDVDFVAEWADHVIILKEGNILTSGTSDLLFDEKWITAADLHLPRLARPFRMLKVDETNLNPKTVKQAAQMIWRLMVGNSKEDIKDNETKKLI